MDIIYIYSTMYTFHLFELIIKLKKQIKKICVYNKKKREEKYYGFTKNAKLLFIYYIHTNSKNFLFKILTITVFSH